MQLGLPFDAGEEPSAGMSPPARPSRESAAPPVPVLFVRHPRARRYVIRLRPDGTIHVTIPRRGSKRQAEAFLQAQHAWIDRQRRRIATARATRLEKWTDGTPVLIDGVMQPLRVHPGDDGAVATLGTLAVAVPPGTTDLRRLVERALWTQARAGLPARLRLLAERHGLEVARVSVRNQRSRWGSAGPNGHITLNWRLVQLPPGVRDYVLVHELMHLRRADHSAAFWKLVAAACPQWKDARAWLRQFDRVREG